MLCWNDSGRQDKVAPCSNSGWLFWFWRCWTPVLKTSCPSSTNVKEKGWNLKTTFVIKKYILVLNDFFFSWRDSPPSGPWRPPHSRGFLWFLDHTQRHTTVSRTPLDEWSARRRDLYLTTHNTHNRQTSMPPRWDSNPRSEQASGRRPTP